MIVVAAVYSPIVLLVHRDCTACAVARSSRRVSVPPPAPRDGLMLASTEESTASVDEVGGQVDMTLPTANWMAAAETTDKRRFL